MIKNIETELVERTLSGDESAYEALVDLNQKMVYNLSLKLTGDVQDAMDLSQEAFLKAYLNLKNFRGESKFSVWLYRLTYNLCLDFLRKSRKTQTISLTQESSDGEEILFDIPDLSAIPETELEKKQLQEQINSAVSSLSEDHRAVFIMREYSDMSYAQIAETLSLSEGTVKSRLSRARQKIVRELLQNGTFEGYRRLKNGKE